MRKSPVERVGASFGPVSEYAGQQPDDELLPEQASDDTDRGWGEAPEDLDDDERLTREKPPHY